MHCTAYHGTANSHSFSACGRHGPRFALEPDHMVVRPRESEMTNRQTSRDSHALGRQPVDERAAEEHVAVGLQQVPADAAVIDDCGNKAPAAAVSALHVRPVLHLACRAEPCAVFKQVLSSKPGAKMGSRRVQQWECWRRGLLSALVSKNASCLSHDREQLAEVEKPTRS